MEIVEADFSLPEHARAFISLMDDYASYMMGGGPGLPSHVKENVPEKLRSMPWSHTVIAFIDNEPAGIAVCFQGFSIFACKPLMNISDMAVAPSHRGKGLSKILLNKVEEIAIRTGCCKMTLEVLEGNTVAQAAYKSHGFSMFEMDPNLGNAMFWEKKLTAGAPV